MTKVTDLTGEEEQVLKLEYDRDGKIIKYGDTPVRYEGDQITIGQMDCLNTGNKLCNINGVYVGDNLRNLTPGVYIVDGKKVVVTNR